MIRADPAGGKTPGEPADTEQDSERKGRTGRGRHRLWGGDTEVGRAESRGTERAPHP